MRDLVLYMGIYRKSGTKHEIKYGGGSKHGTLGQPTIPDSGGKVKGEIGEIYSLLTFGLQNTTRRIFISTYTHHFVTSLYVTPKFSEGSYYTHLGSREL
jgi:hypothetical protein